MLAPASERESTRDVLGPPPARPPQNLMAFSPPSYNNAISSAGIIKLPDVPTEPPTPLPPLAFSNGNASPDVKLPSLSSLTNDIVLSPPPNGQWPSLNSLSAYHAPGPLGLQSIDSPSRMDLDTCSNSVISAASPDTLHDARATSVSLDDPDVRLAAEALGDLRADFVSSPPNRNTSLPLSPPTSHGFQSSNRTRTQSPNPEPLLSLLTTSHPLLASTIEGATSAYGGAKNFSPRFRSGAEYVEGYLTPIANTVGSVGRVTGVEGGVRWFLGGRKQNGDLETGHGKKRRKEDNENEPISNKRLELEGTPTAALQHLPGENLAQLDLSFPSSKAGSRRMSTTSTVDTLPAYDEARSPAYTETADEQNSPRPTPRANAAWQSRLITSTSGLSVAMSEESLRSLKYCLRWLRWANDHIARVIGALKGTLDEYEQAPSSAGQGCPEKAAILNGHVNGQDGQSRAELAARIASLKNDVLKTLRDAITTVSKYAGGALPENARILVRRHLTSLPQRFRVATMSDKNAQNGDKDSETALTEGAHKVLVLAKEGLDMVAQVSGVLDGTIVSAEEWLDRMGKRRGQEEKPMLPQTESGGDVKMG